MKVSDFKEEWNRNGYFIVPQLFDASLVRRLREICDGILEQWLAASSKPEEAANYPNMAYLTEARYFKVHPERLPTLLEAIAHEKTIAIFEDVFNAEPLFHNTQYFFEPATGSRAGAWHRDQQFISPEAEAEKAAMSEVGLHLHIALVPDDNLEIVPGTHARWDTPEELEIRKGLNGKKLDDPLPEAARVPLEAGDGCFFSAWSLHRGHYVAGQVRRTFDVIYGTAPSSLYTPPPMCFLETNALDGLTSQARLFFERFINAYKDKWERGEYEY